ncbi:hypothetical protein EYF80_035613 [Liparis tanakae]|uniref:Uncharacterized protein n=1 Tax=Liparis tanakae TaxID=230148 RepID=A0A4Z2GLN8_9TELE|nr:hypothetical protein EYF80_035613 [Liparis tanakae]
MQMHAGQYFSFTLDIEHSLHADLVHSLLSELGTDAEDLVSVRRHHSDAGVVQLTPGHWPLLAQLFHPLHNLKYLRRWRNMNEGGGDKARCLLHILITKHNNNCRKSYFPPRSSWQRYWEVLRVTTTTRCLRMSSFVGIRKLTCVLEMRQYCWTKGWTVFTQRFLKYTLRRETEESQRETFRQIDSETLGFSMTQSVVILDNQSLVQDRLSKELIGRQRDLIASKEAALQVGHRFIGTEFYDGFTRRVPALCSDQELLPCCHQVF